jgi:hypothetical protein
MIRPLLILALLVHVMQVNALEILDDYHENDNPSSYDISFLAEPALSLIFSNEAIKTLRDVSRDMGLYSDFRDAGPEIRESVINKLVTTEGLEKTRLRSKFNNMLLWIPTKKGHCAWHNGLRIKLETDIPLLYFSRHELGPSESIVGKNAVKVMSDARSMLPDVLFDKGSTVIGIDSKIQALIVQPPTLRYPGDRKPNNFRFIVLPIFSARLNKKVITGFVGLW